MSEERETACYNQNCEQFRSMNQIMWQVPVLAMTLTGGLWFGAGQLKDYTVIKVLLFVLAACSDIAFFVVLMRIRFVMGAYLKKIEEFHPMSFVKADGTGLCRSKMVVHTFSSLLLGAAGVSVVGAIVVAGTSPEDVTPQPIAYYNSEASRLADEYEQVSFENVHATLLPHLPSPPARVLEVGAGSGRDAAALARMGYKVKAVEPAKAMREIALSIHPELKDRLLDDRLPDLGKIGKANFDLILLSAVWMHLPSHQRVHALGRLKELLASNGKLAITIRIGKPDPSRGMYEIAPDDVVKGAMANGLKLISRSDQPDVLGRHTVSWTTLIFSL